MKPENINDDQNKNENEPIIIHSTVGSMRKEGIRLLSGNKYTLILKPKKFVYSF
ncbi:MAG: hypothetical protein JXJ04_00700 [Spirochaetales bacterium]|nr:hypothetical protein [Spirochaetales bacterium]